MKAGDLVQYNSRLLLVLGPNPDDYGYAAGWWRCQEIGTNRVRIYSPTQLTIIKTEKEFYNALIRTKQNDSLYKQV